MECRSGKCGTSDSPPLTVTTSTTLVTYPLRHHQGIQTTVEGEASFDISKMLMDAVETREEVRREEGILCRLQEEEVKEKNRKEKQMKEEENEAAEFNRLHSLLPFLGSKSVTELDIVLEAITYIHLLQARLQGGAQRQ